MQALQDAETLRAIDVAMFPHVDADARDRFRLQLQASQDAAAADDPDVAALARLGIKARVSDEAAD